MKPRELPPPVVPTPLLPWLLTALHPTNRTRVKELLRSGRVHVNGVATTRHDHPLTPADRVAIAPETSPQAAALARHGIAILYEDAHLIAIDKPAGLLTVATAGEKTETAFALLHAHHRDRPFVVHRLDRDTSGVLLFAKSPAVRDALQEAWDSAEKTYLAAVDGVPDPPEGTVDNFLAEGKDLRVRSVRETAEGAKRAVSRYRVVVRAGRLSLVEVRIDTGRKHQIRVHLAGLGCPVIGDRLYGNGVNPAGRLGLHARRLAFDHPTTGERVTVEAVFPVGLRKWFPSGVVW
jgi:23S rRNA pseudouridine1911/1915/1917 synthase